MKEITTKELAEKLKKGEKLHMIDVRENEEVIQGMVPGARHIPLGELPNRLSELDKEKHYHMICRSGGRSGKACTFLKKHGYDVTNISGGMLDWEDAVEK